MHNNDLLMLIERYCLCSAFNPLNVCAVHWEVCITLEGPSRIPEGYLEHIGEYDEHTRK